MIKEIINILNLKFNKKGQSLLTIIITLVTICVVLYLSYLLYTKSDSLIPGGD